MKKVLFLSLMVALMTTTQLIAQDTYYILAVKGKILNKRTNQLLKGRQKIKSSDQVVFKDKNARALIFARGVQGRFVLQLKPQQKSANEFITLVKKSIFSQKNGAYVRSNLIKSKKDLLELFLNKPLVILDKLELEFESLSFSQLTNNEEGVFFVRYEYEGKTRNLALKLDGNKLTLTKENIFRTKDGWIDQTKVKNMIFSYYKKEKKEMVLFDGDKHLQFLPFFLTEEDLKNEGVYALAEHLTKLQKDKGKLIQELAYYLVGYGTINGNNIEDWYNKHFK